MLSPPPRPLAEVTAALASARPRCVVEASGGADHTMQIHAGLHALHGARLIRLDGAPAAPREAHGVQVRLEGTGRVFFDVRDGPLLYPLAAGVALYAKRSCPDAAPPNVVPLGLNYPMHPRRVGVLARRWPLLHRALRTPSEPAAVAAALEPRALFFARTWDPAQAPDEWDIDALNETRAQCIRALRRRFGKRFLGGFARSAFALRHFPDAVVPEEFSTRRRDYLRLLRTIPVGVATTGLSGSTGWKFAEYIALARAVVCEPLRYRASGPMAPRRNYLEFASVDECVERVGQLLEDRAARVEMMQANEHYWREYGTPAAVVARVLHTALLRS